MITFDAVKACEELRRTAMVAADVETLGTLFADELMWIHATGRADSKESFLKNLKDGGTEYISIEVDDDTLRVVNDVALYTGRARMKLKSKGELRELENKFTIVWARIDDELRVVNWQSTAIRKP